MFVRMPPEAVLSTYASGKAVPLRALAVEEGIVLDAAAEAATIARNLGEVVKQAIIDAVTRGEVWRGLPLAIPLPVRDGVIYDEEADIEGEDATIARVAAWALLNRFATLDLGGGTINYAGKNTEVPPAEALRLTLLSGSEQAADALKKGAPGLRIGIGEATYEEGGVAVLIRPSLDPDTPLKVWAVVKVAGNDLLFPIETSDVSEGGSVRDLLKDLAGKARDLLEEHRDHISSLDNLLKAGMGGVAIRVNVGPANLIVPRQYPARLYIIANPDYVEEVPKHLGSAERVGRKTYALRDAITTPAQLKQAIMAVLDAMGNVLIDKVAEITEELRMVEGERAGGAAPPGPRAGH